MTRKYNYGLAVLRMFMCFFVVLCHFWQYDGDNFCLKMLLQLRQLAVPVFMLMSFYLMKDFFFAVDRKNTKKRYVRLIYPYVFWAVVYWLVFDLLEILYGDKQLSCISDLGWQFLGGHSPNLNPVLWYQWVLLVLTTIFSVLFYYYNKKALYWLSLMFVIAVLFEYLGINFALFGGLRYELKYPLGRITEMIPYAVLGLLLAGYNVFESYRSTVVKWGGILFVIGLLKLIFKMKSLQDFGFGYSGMNLVGGSLLIFAFFYWLPLDGLAEKSKDMVKYITSHTLGIYCMHMMVGRWMVEVFSGLGWDVYTLFMCVSIYILCFIMTNIIAKLPFDWSRKMVD